MNSKAIEKRQKLIGILTFLIMTGILISTNFIKLNGGSAWGEVTLHEVLSTILFPYLMISKIFNLTNRFVDWLFEITEE